MFVHGFNKTAGISESVARGLGAVKGTVQAGTKAVGKFIEKKKRVFGQEFTAARKKQLSGMETGSRLGLKRAGPGAAPEVAMAAQQKAREEVMKRAKNVANIRDQNKPSFAAKHPYLTAGGAFLAGRYAFGEKKKEEAPPAVQYPQQY